VIPTLQESAAEMIGAVVCPPPDDVLLLEEGNGSSGSPETFPGRENP